MNRRKRRAKSKAFPPGRSSSSRLPSGSLRNFIIFILFSVLIATGLLATRYRVESKNRKKELAAAEAKLQSDAEQTSSIEAEVTDAVESGDTSRLEELLDLLIIDPDEEFAVQLEKIKNRLVISEALLNMSADPGARQFGLLSGLDALTLWHTLNVIYEVDDPGLHRQLKELAGGHVDDDDSKVAARANYVLALVKIHRFIISGEPADFSLGLRHYRRTLEEVGDDLVEVIRISNLASLLAKSGNDAEVRQLWDLFFDRFNNSDNAVIQSLADKAYDQYVFAGSRLADSLKQIIAGDSEAVVVFRNQVDELVQSFQLSNGGFDQLLSMLEVLVQTGDAQQVEAMAQSLRDRLPSIGGRADIEGVKRKLDSLLNRVKLVGQEFEFTGLIDAYGRGFQPSILDDCKVLVVFWSPGNTSSMERLASVHKMVGMFDGSQLRLVAVMNPPPTTMLEGTGEAKEVKLKSLNDAVAVFPESLPNCHFVKVDSSNGRLLRLLRQLGPPFLPYMVMVDRGHEIIALNPNPENLIELLGGVK